MTKSSQHSKSTSSPSKLEKLSEIQRAIPSAMADVNQIIEAHGLHPKPKQFTREPKTVEESIETVIHIFDRFHRVACTPSYKRDIEFVFDVSGEKEVQDIMYGLLRMHFDSVIKEESTESVAGSTTFIDFIIPECRIGIEVKMGYHGNRKVREQINDDKGNYVVHSRCDLLLVYVYDPKYKIDNPDQFEADLNTNISGLETRARAHYHNSKIGLIVKNWSSKKIKSVHISIITCQRNKVY